MEAFLILLFLGLVVVVLVLPIAAMGSAARSRRIVEELRSQLTTLEREVHDLQRKVETPAAAGSDTASAAAESKAMASVPVQVTAVTPTPTPPPPVGAPSVTAPPVLGRAVATPPAEEGILGGTVAPGESPRPAAAFAAGTPRRLEPVPSLLERLPKVNWEQFMGVKLFAWLGGFALFLAVAYFVKYSFEHNLVPPEVRIALGFLVGIGLVVGGVQMRNKDYRVTSQTLCATGVVSLYAVTFAAHSIYHLAWFGQVPTFLLMTLITAAAFVLAVRLEAQVVALLGMLGGFLTPILLSTGRDNPLGLFTYIALLDIGLVAVAAHRPWSYLVALAAVGTGLMEIAWVDRFFAVDRVMVAWTVFLTFDVLFLAAFGYAHRRQGADRWLIGAAAGLPLLTYAFAAQWLSFAELGARPGVVFSLVFGADLCLLALVFWRLDLAVLQFAGGGGAFLLLAAWNAKHLDADLLYWALALALVFALLHSLFPVVLQRIRRSPHPLWWAHFFPPAAMLLVMLPLLLKSEFFSFMAWPVILLLDLLVFGLAVMTLSISAILVALLLTLVAMFLWVVGEHFDAGHLPTTLLTLGGFAVFFLVAGALATRKILARAKSEGSAAGTLSFFSLTGAKTPEDLQSQVPALSGALPFILLILMVLRLRLTEPSSVFGLALLLVVLLLGTARAFRMSLLVPVALGCVVTLEYVWYEQAAMPLQRPLVALAWQLGFSAIFVVFPFVTEKHWKDAVLPWGCGALAAPLHFFLVHRLVGYHYPNAYMGLLPAAFSLPMLGCLALLAKRLPTSHPGRISLLALFGGAALFFITLVFPIQFSREWLTLGWALEGVALCWLFHRIPHPGLRLVGVVLLAVSFARLAFNSAVFSYHPRSATALLNWYLYVYGITAACLFAGARVLQAPRNFVLGYNVVPWLMAMGTALVFLLLNIEISDYFTEPNEASLTFRFSGNFARDMTYTIGWALFALVLVVVGLLRKVAAARYAGLGLLAVTLMKLFFHDLAHLSQLYIVGALFVVAVVAMVASYLYQRFLSNPTKANETPSS